MWRHGFKQVRIHLGPSREGDWRHYFQLDTSLLKQLLWKHTVLPCPTFVSKVPLDPSRMTRTNGLTVEPLYPSAGRGEKVDPQDQTKQVKGSVKA